MDPFSPEELVEQLHEHNVEFVMVGGFAGTLHGARRTTMDIDVVPRWTDENLQRLCDVLRELDARASSGPPCSGDDITPDVLREREVMTWDTSRGHIDTLLGIPNQDGEPVDYEQLVSRAGRVDFEGLTIVVASLDDIITSKEFAHRRKDTEALPELRRIAEARKAGHPPSGTE